jgi:hypothetical protein
MKKNSNHSAKNWLLLLFKLTMFLMQELFLLNQFLMFGPN